jgi:hypothetical protein
MVLVENLERKKPLGRQRCRCEDNFKRIFKKYVGIAYSVLICLWIRRSGGTL